MRRALTRVDQVGLKIRGVTRELGTGQCWEFVGEIDPSGFVRATHSALDSGQTIVKSLLLAIEGDGEGLIGLWARHDAEAREIDSGSWQMRRAAAEI